MSPEEVDSLCEAVARAINGAPGMSYVEGYEGSMVGRTHAINVAEDAIRAFFPARTCSVCEGWGAYCDEHRPGGQAA